ncbi:MAG: hypothetical protein WAN16_11405 [Chthoniobacterales bacterium]
MTTDTPRTDACPHCGAKQIPHITEVDEYVCETHTSKGGGNTYRSKLCRERERHQDALLRHSEELAASKAEVERLKANLARAVEIAHRVAYTDSPDLWEELDQLEATLKEPTK